MADELEKMTSKSFLKKCCCAIQTHPYFTNAPVIIGMFMLIGFLIFGIISYVKSLLKPTLFDTFGVISDFQLIAVYILLICVIVGIIFNKPNQGKDRIEAGNINQEVITNNDNQQSHKSHVNHSKEHTILSAICSILGIGDSLAILTRIYDQSLWLINQNFTSEKCKFYIIVSICENSFKCFCHLFILIFIINSHNYNLNGRLGRFIELFSLFSFVEWSILQFQEIHQENNKHDSCINSNMSSNLSSFEEIEPFLYPLGAEFRIFCGIELLAIAKAASLIAFYKCINAGALRVWNGIKSSTISNGSQLQGPENPENPTLLTNNPDSEDQPLLTNNPTSANQTLLVNNPDSAHQSACMKMWNFFALVACIILVSGSVIFIFFQDSNATDNSIITLSSEICEIALASLISLHTLVSFIWPLRSCCNKTETMNAKKQYDKKAELNIDLIFLILANGALIVYCGFTCHGSLNYPEKDTLRLLTIIVSFIPIFQSILQTIIIFIICKYKRNARQNMNIWIMLSFAVWLFDTFSAKEYETNSIQLHYYGEKKWKFIAASLIPMTIFYRFHSCIIFLKIKGDLYYDHNNNK